MTISTAFGQYWKLPEGWLDRKTPIKGQYACKLVQASGHAKTAHMFLFGSNTLFSSDERQPDPLLHKTFLPLVDTRDNKTIASSGLSDDYLYMPFNIEDAIRAFHFERYTDTGGRQKLVKLVRQLYYRIRPLIPRSVQIRFRQSITGLQEKQSFPSWPLDTSLDQLCRTLLALIMRASALNELPFIWFWPKGYRYTVILTHDVEQALGHDNVWAIVELEKKYGFRSLWNFVPQRYHVDPGTLARLTSEGFEIGVHGLYHDGKLFDSRRIFEERVEPINLYLRAWDSQAFRAPAAVRNLEWIAERINSRYDSSCPTSEIHAPQPGGCCTVFPFMIGEMVELPFTMPQDHTLFTILKHQDEHLWIEVASQIAQQSGLINIIVHPDYMLNPKDLAHYERFLIWLAEQHDCWVALPKHVAAWWRTRNDACLEAEGKGWRITGVNASQAQIAYAVIDGEATGITYHL